MTNPVFRIASCELTKMYRDGRSKSLILIVLLFIISSMVFSFFNYQENQKEYEENLKQARVNWESQVAKDPHDAAHDGTYVIKPFHPFALLDRGIQQYTGKVVHLSAHQRKQSTLNESKDHSGMFRFGQLSPNFVLLFLFPLLLIFIAYNTFTEEKEKQTLKLLLTQGATGRHLAIGKWLAVLFQITLLTIVFFIIAIIFTSLNSSNIGGSSMEWLSLFGIYLLYFIVFANIVLLISAKAKSSGVSLTISLAIWIVVTLIAPKVSTNLAGDIHPFPTLQDFRDNINTDQTNGLNGHNFWNEAAQTFQQKVLDEYGVESIEDLPVLYGGLLLAEGEKYESEVYTKHFNLLREQYEKQRSVYRLTSIISPFLPVKFFSMALSRTDYGFQWHFEDQAEKYRVDFNTALNMNIAENAKGVENYKADEDLWKDISEFDYEWQPGSTIISNHRAEFQIMFFWAIISFLIMILFTDKIKAI